MALFLPGSRNASGTNWTNARHLGEPLGGLVDDGEGRLAEGIDDATGIDRADPLDQAGAEVALHPLHGGGEGGAVLGSLELPTMLGVVPPPAAGNDGLSRLQIRQGADEGDEPLVIHRGDRLTVASFRSEASDGEAGPRILKRDALHHTA
jgi:hypothetical protein